MRRTMIAAALAAVAGTAQAADQQQRLSMTIYNNDLALVEDTRRLDMAQGRSRIEFKDVSASIKPETVALAGPGFGIVEQNFDYDLLTPSKMMEKAVGHEVEIVRTIPGTGATTKEKATVLSVNSGVVLKIGNRIEVLSADGLPTRVIFDSIPENLRAQPTLSVTVDAAHAGPRDTTLSYMTTGLSWKDDYVAMFDEKASKLKLQGWVTINNNSGTSFKDARTQLVAGDINVDGVGSYQQRQMGSRGAGTGNAGAASVADYYLYTLPERVTVAEAQTKQVGFLDLNNVTAKKNYEIRAYGFSSSENPDHADVNIDFSNTERAMPAGTIRVYLRDEAGEPKFVGENAISHAPAGSELTVHIGEAFDVTSQPTLISTETLSKTRTRYTMSYLLRNARSNPVTVELRQSGLAGDTEIDKESLPSRRIDAGTLGWSVPVPAHGETKLTFAVDEGH